MYWCHFVRRTHYNNTNHVIEISVLHFAKYLYGEKKVIVVKYLTQTFQSLLLCVLLLFVHLPRRLYSVKRRADLLEMISFAVFFIKKIRIQVKIRRIYTFTRFIPQFPEL